MSYESQFTTCNGEGVYYVTYGDRVLFCSQSQPQNDWKISDIPLSCVGDPGSYILDGNKKILCDSIISTGIERPSKSKL